MDIDGYQIPEGLYYTKEHEWAKATARTIVVGITDYAAKTLNDVVYVTFPKLGSEVTQFKSMGTVESIKAVSELYSPISGKVTKVNADLESHPEMVNKSPYAAGWLLELESKDFPSESKSLLDAKGYSAYIHGLVQKQ
jgi:glycine cleavage system H protein